jgi:hypothetical protein
MDEWDIRYIMYIGIFLALLSASCCLPFKKYSKNSTYIILNLLYIIPGTLSALMCINNFYEIYNFYDIPLILAVIISVFFLMFYFMSLTFTILLHPLVQIVIFLFTLKNKYISKKYIIIVFILSIIIAFVYLYLIKVKKLILTA